MKWSELPQEYRDLDVGTRQGWSFWYKCHKAKTIDELPPIQKSSMIFDKGWEDEEGVKFVLPEKWCVKGSDGSDIHRWFKNKLGRVVSADNQCYFHYPEYLPSMCTAVCKAIEYTEITYEQWVKYVKDGEYIENALMQNDNLEKIKEMRDVVNDIDQENRTFYMIYDDGKQCSTKKHDHYDSAFKEARRLSSCSLGKVFILQAIESFERTFEVKKQKLN